MKFLGFPLARFAFGTKVLTVSTNPQLNFSPRCLFIDDSGDCRDLSVLRVSIGIKLEVATNVEAIPARLFRIEHMAKMLDERGGLSVDVSVRLGSARMAWPFLMELPCIRPGMVAALTLGNPSGVERVAHAAFGGEVVA